MDSKEIYPLTSYSWFPGHMAEAKKKIVPVFKVADALLEVRDARAPLASSNNFFDRLVPSHKKILLFNKANLSNPRYTKLWREYFDAKQERFIFTNFQDPAEVAKLLKYLKNFVALKQNKSPDAKKRLIPFRVAVYGLPNTGKTTLINRLLRRNALKVGAKPGVTKSLVWVEIDQRLEILDSPGIMEKGAKDEKEATVLALIYALEAKDLPLEAVAATLLRCLAEQQDGLSPAIKDLPLSASGNLAEALAARWHLDRLQLNDRQERFFRKLIQEFREGKLGQISLEKPASDDAEQPLPEEEAAWQE